MSVLVVAVGIHTETGSLHSAFGAHRLCFAILLRHKSRCRQFTELQLGLYTEKRRTSLDERRPGGHTHISGFYQLDYFVLLTLILKFEILRVEVKCCIGVISHIKLHFVAHRCINSGLNLLVEVEIGLAASINR